MQILMLTPDPLLGHVIACAARRLGDSMECASDLSRISGSGIAPGVVIIDCETPDAGVMATVRAAASSFSRARLIVMAETVSAEQARQLGRLSVSHVLTKPLHPASLLAMAAPLAEHSDAANDTRGRAWVRERFRRLSHRLDRSNRR